MNGGNVGKYIRLDQIFFFFFLSSHFSPAKKKYPAWKRFRFLTLSIKNSIKVFLFILDFTRRRSWGRFVFLLLNNVFSLLTPW